jgi:hypothetical protein
VSDPKYLQHHTNADTAASGHYLWTKDPHHTNGTTKTPILLGLPNGTCLKSTNKMCSLALPQSPSAACDAFILPALIHSSLVSIGKPCDAGCTATFDKHQVIIQRDDSTLLQGTRDFQTGVWHFPLSITTTPNAQPPTLLIFE